MKISELDNIIVRLVFVYKHFRYDSIGDYDDFVSLIKSVYPDLDYFSILYILLGVEKQLIEIKLKEKKEMINYLMNYFKEICHE